MLKHIKVTNFRSLDNFSMDFNEGLNVIIANLRKNRTIPTAPGKLINL